MQKIGAFLIVWFVWFVAAMALSAAGTAADLQVLVPAREAEVSFQPVDESRVLVTVTDSDGNPFRGLTPEDFAVGSGIRRAEILGVQSLETDEQIPLNIVLVVDNSFSMLDRRAVDPLLNALDKFFEMVRPIDNVHAVVFKKGDPIAVKTRGLHVERFKSSSPEALRGFFRQAFDQGLTGKTYLNEAVLAGLDLIQKMPANEQKFLVVFSDGEDLNSEYDIDQIEIEAFGIDNFNVYCIDYMPRPRVDEFLSRFSREHGGRIWKAKSAAEIMPIFDEFTSTLKYRYLVTYAFASPVSLQPSELKFEMLTTTAGEPITNRIFFQTGSSAIPDKYQQFAGKFQADAFDEDMLQTALERYFNLLNIVGRRLRENPAARIQIYGGVSDAAAEQATPDLATQRARSVQNYLNDIWSIEAHRMEIAPMEDKPQSGVSPVAGGRAERQCAEIVYTAAELQERVPDEFVAETSRVSQLQVTTRIFSGAEPADWELSIFAGDRKLYAVSGSGDIPPEHNIALQELNPGLLTGLGALEARLRVKDARGGIQEAGSDLCHIRLSRRELINELALPPGGMLALEPPSLKVEELTMIDSSPLLNYVFFETNRSEIPERYVRLSGPSDVQSFDVQALKGTMEKYYNVLNIIGKRLRDNPDANVRIVGCNSNTGEERGRLDLSRGRADAVKAYLHYVWGIDSSRMQVQTRNLPEVVSNNRIPEGQAENRRVEIYSDNDAILDTVRSTYVVAVSDTENLRIVPEIVAGYELAGWQLQLTGDDQVLESLQGVGDLAPVYTIALADLGLLKMGDYRNVTARLTVEDRRGQQFTAEDSSAISFVRREQRVALQEGYRVMEKYALILFDFDRTDIKARNKVIVDRIIDRIADISSPRVRIVGHTDTIGKEAYNVSLSERRAEAAFRQMQAAGLKETVDISHEGAGPFKPMYDNELPEGRALNRTVTVTIEYEQND